jgi:Mg-chelatase subunit ChlD
VAVFTANSTPYNATRIVGNRTTGSTNGNVQLFFGKLFNNTAFQPSMASTVTTPGFLKRDITLVLDRSGSMEESAGGGQNRWQALLTALGYFRTAVESTEDTEKIGLASYSDNGTINRYLTTNYDNVASSVMSLNTDGSTNITDGITKGISVATGSGNRSATDSEVERLMVLMTDGLHNQGVGPQTKITALNNANIRVIAITFGADADTENMQAIAEACRGKHYHAPNGATLQQIFTQIGLGLDGLQYAE